MKCSPPTGLWSLPDHLTELALFGDHLTRVASVTRPLNKGLLGLESNDSDAEKVATKIADH